MTVALKVKHLHSALWRHDVAGGGFARVAPVVMAIRPQPVEDLARLLHDQIALARLLARSAGAPMPTLIIDEGFGTQDSSGIEKVKEAINSIQEDFQKILVITHIDELRDAFPTHIDIVKTASGSTIEIN